MGESAARMAIPLEESERPVDEGVAISAEVAELEFQFGPPGSTSEIVSDVATGVVKVWLAKGPPSGPQYPTFDPFLPTKLRDPGDCPQAQDAKTETTMASGTQRAAMKKDVLAEGSTMADSCV